MDIFSLYSIAFLNFGGAIKTMLKGFYKVWNSLIGAAYDVLLMLPSDVKGMSSILNSINTVFVGVATTLVVLSFVLGFCSETTNVREEMRFDTIVKYLVRLCVAEYFTIHSKEILMQILKICKRFCKVLKSYSKIKKAKLHITAEETKVIDELGIFESVAVLVLVTFLGLVLFYLGCSIVWTVYTRFLKTVLMIPFGSLAFATMAAPGGGEVSRISSSYTKAFLANAMSSIVIALAIIFGISLMNGLPITIMGGKNTFMSAVGIVLGKVLQSSVLVGCVKEAEHLMERMMGAY